MERLQKVIANAGICSRRKAEELIKDGKVIVNGKKVTDMGIKVSEEDSILVNNKPIKKDDKKYFLLYKPRAIISSVSDDKKRQTVVDLIDTNVRLYPVGRLDYDTSGIILLTNDGDLANIIMHPRNNVEKVYIAKIDGQLTKDDVNKLYSGIEIDEKKVKATKVRVKKQNKDHFIVEIVICEGLNHQIKKMFKALGKNVLKLKRERIAFLDLKGLKPGEYRSLSIKEVKQLYSLKK